MVDLRDSDPYQFGYTPLGVAAAEGHPEVVSVLIRKGADPTVQDVVGHPIEGCYPICFSLERPRCMLLQEQVNCL